MEEEYLTKKLPSLSNDAMEVKAFISRVTLPDDENCFEHTYLKNFAETLNRFAKRNENLCVVKTMKARRYSMIIQKKKVLSDPNDANRSCKIDIRVFSCDSPCGRFAKITFDEKVFFLKRADNHKLMLPAWD